jgi:hypothetical protein
MRLETAIESLSLKLLRRQRTLDLYAPVSDLHVEVYALHDFWWWGPIEELPLKVDRIFTLGVMG